MPFVPPNAQGNPVQGIRSPAHQAYQPIVGPPGKDFYYIDSHGRLLRKDGLSNDKPALVARIGTGYRSLAVSPDGDYFAVLHDGAVYTGPMGSGKLTMRDAGGFTSLSWDRNDNLRAAGPSNVVMLAATSKPTAGPSAVFVDYQSDTTCPGSSGAITQLRVAPDGVRVALVIAGQEPTLAFGAIVTLDQSRAGQPQSLVHVNLSPFFVCGAAAGAFRSLTWYGGDNVIALAQDGTALTEYPVNGGTQTPIPGKAGIQSITARMGGGVIAGVGDAMFIDPNATGAWNPVGAGLSPAYPG
jgi:hypothetical protein